MGDRPHVVNASPLILLARIDRLDLLAVLGKDLRVPRRVVRELEAGNARDGAADRVLGFGGVRVVEDVAEDPRVSAWRIDAGETQVISHALALERAVVVLDDLAARRCAEGLGLDRVGTAGLVVLAKTRGVVPSAAELLGALRAHGMHLSPQVQSRLLARVGEA